MNNLSARTNLNPDFKLVQPLPRLPGQPASPSVNWLQLGGSDRLKYPVRAGLQHAPGQISAGSFQLASVARPENASNLLSAGAGTSL